MIFRLFVSSTFEDMKLERDLLRQVVFPRISEFLSAKGHSFSAIDLRWGVSTESSLDHSTMDICFEELKRAQEATPKPNFLILMGQRYGWIPLPNKITFQEHKELCEHINPRYLSLFTSQYIQDLNAADGCYILQKREGELSEPSIWNRQVEEPLRNAIIEALQHCEIADRHKFTASATEQEILMGALNEHVSPDHVVYFQRKLRNINGSHQSSFLNLLPDGKPDADADMKLGALETRLLNTLGAERVLLESEFLDGKFEPDYKERFCRAIYDQLMHSLTSALTEQPNDWESEEMLHHRHADKQKLFPCWENFQTTLTHIQSRTGVFAVTGERDIGKTSFLTQLYQGPSGAKFIRYCGLTKRSANRITLVEDLAQAIISIQKIHTEIPNGSPEERLAFALACNTEELTLCIDDIESVDSGGYSLLSMFPKSLSPHLRLIVTCQKAPMSSSEFPLNTWKPDEMESFCMSYLKSHNRQLSQEQKKTLIAQLNISSSPNDITMLCAEAIQWRNGETPILPNQSNLCHLVLQRIAKEFGDNFTSYALGLLASSRDGLTQQELSDMLTGVPAVMDEYSQMYPMSPQTEAIPPIIISRFLFRMEPYLETRRDSAYELLRIANPDLTNTLQRDYGKLCEKIIIAFFNKQPLWLDEIKRLPNQRKLRELPLLLQKRQPHEFAMLFSDFSFWEAMVYAGLSQEALQLSPADSNDDAGYFHRITAKLSPYLDRHPALLFSALMTDKDIPNQIHARVHETSNHPVFLEEAPVRNRQKKKRRTTLQVNDVRAFAYGEDGEMYIDTAVGIRKYNPQTHTLAPQVTEHALFPYTITKDHKLCAKSETEPTQPQSVDYPGEAADKSVDFAQGIAYIDDEKVFFKKDGQVYELLCPDRKGINAPYIRKTIFYGGIILALMVASIIVPYPPQLAFLDYFSLLPIFFFIRTLKLWYDAHSNHFLGKDNFSGRLCAVSLSSLNNQLVVLTERGFILFANEQCIKEGNFRLQILGVAEDITGLDDGKKLMNSIQKGYIKMRTDNYGNLLVCGLDCFNVFHGRRNKKRFLLRHGAYVNYQNADGHIVCIYDRLRRNYTEMLFSRNRRKSVFALSLKSMRRVKIFKGISTSDNNYVFLEVLIDDRQRILYLQIENEKRLIIKKLSSRFYNRLKFFGISPRVEKIAGLESFGTREEAYYMDDSTIVCCHKAEHAEIFSWENPYIIEHINAKTNKRKQLRFYATPSIWIRHENLLFLCSEKTRLLVDTARLKLIRSFVSWGWYYRWLGLPRLLICALCGFSLYQTMVFAFGPQSSGLYAFVTILCFYVAQLLGTIKVELKGGRHGDSENPRFVNDDCIELDQDTSINYVKGEIVRNDRFDYKAFVSNIRYVLIFSLTMCVVLGLFVWGLMALSAVLSGDNQRTSIINVNWGNWLCLIFPLFICGIFGSPLFYVFNLQTKEFSPKGKSTYMDDWKCRFQTRPSHVVISKPEGNRHFIQIVNKEGNIVAETMSDHRIYSIIHSPSQTSALMLSEEGESVLLRIHRKEKQPQVLAKRLSARRGRVRLSFKDCLPDIAALLLLCAGTVASGYWHGVLPIATPILGFITALWTIYIVTR